MTTKAPRRKPARKAIGPKLAKMANITAVMGATGAGKSTYVRQRIRMDKPRRLLIWDLKGEFGEVAPITENLATVAASVRHKSEFKIGFCPSRDQDVRKKQFNLFCKIAYAVGDVYLVVEELAFVTSPSHACEGWASCTLLGRDKGMVIIGTSQRPASIDKHFFSNATIVRTGRLNTRNDRKTLADVLEVPLVDVLQLLPLQFIEKNMNTQEIKTGTLTI